MARVTLEDGRVVSHQRRWQLANAERGLCMACKDFAVTAKYCELHRRKRNANQTKYRKARKAEEAS